MEFYGFGFAFGLEGDVVGAVDGLLAAEADVEYVKVLHPRRSKQSASAHLAISTVTKINSINSIFYPENN